MKQHITKEQFDEFNKDFLRSKTGWIYHVDITIGKMIEFLGENYCDVIVRVSDKVNKYINYKVLKPEELADALWEAVKEKLNK